MVLLLFSCISMLCPKVLINPAKRNVSLLQNEM